MSAPISFTVRPPTYSSTSSSTVPARPSPLANGSRSKAGPPSRRLFDQSNGHDSDEDDHSWPSRSDSRKDDRRRREDSGNRSDRERSKGSKVSGPLVIPALPNKDWRESSRRVPTYKPEARRTEEEEGNHERIGDGPQLSGIKHWGKDVKPDIGAIESSVQSTGGINGDSSRNGAQVKIEEGLEHSHISPEGEPIASGVKTEPLTLEEQALRELLSGETKTESAEDRAQRELVISLQSDRVLSETEALQRDLGALPESSTMEDFEAVPISAFGIAALRGMGWDPNAKDNVKPREVQRRPQLLGLGATPLDVTLPANGKSRKELEREKEKREKKKSREERTGRGFVVANLMLKKGREGTADSSTINGGSGTSTPNMRESRSGSYETGTESDASRRRRRDEDDDGRRYDSGRESKRRDERDRDGRRYETEEERARRKARERERDRDRERDGGREKERYSDRAGDKERYRDKDGDRYRDDRRDRDRDDSRDRRP